jgi:hypothetical protein
MPRHHTVPEVYLKGFFDPDKVAVRQNVLWLYEENRKIRPRGADAVAAVEGFNLEPEIAGKQDAAESAYQKLEDAATPVLEKLRASDPRLTEEEKGTFSYFIGFQKFRTTLYRETVNAAGIDVFRHTCRRLLDEKRVHEIVGTTEAERSGRVRFSLKDAEKFVSDLADGTIGLMQSSNGWALVGALEGGQKLTPMLARIHWTLCEAAAFEPWLTTDNPVALFEPFPVRPKQELYGPSLQFLFPISPRFLIFGEPMTKGPDYRVRVPAENVRMMTDDLLRIAHRQVYASFFSRELQPRVNRAFKEREPLIVPMPVGYRG